MKINVKCKPCPGCKKTHTVRVEEHDFYRWQGGILIQNAFRYLDNSQRELLMTGYCGPCWDVLWKDMEEEML